MSVTAHGQPRSRMVSLSIIIEFMCQKGYTDLMQLVDVLSSKSDLEKKIELAKFLSRTRNLFIRLEALAKWANSSSKVDKCEKITNFLEEQCRLLHDTANALDIIHRLHVVSARLPLFNVNAALDVFVNKSYTRLPKVIKRICLSNEQVSKEEIRMAIPDLNRAIKHRLSVMKLPQQFTNIVIDNGRVTFTVLNEFKVTLTVLSDALDAPWAITAVEFLVQDSSRVETGPLVHPMQALFIRQHAQSRIFFKNSDKRPSLVHLYDMLHAFALSLQLDVLCVQAKRMHVRRSTEPFGVEEYVPGKLLRVAYWRGLSESKYEATMGPDGKLQPRAYTLTLQVDPVDSRRPLCVHHEPPLAPHDTARVGACPHLCLESLLTRTMVARAAAILADARAALAPLLPPSGAVDHNSAAPTPLALSLALLSPCLPHELLTLRVDPAQGLLRASLPALSQPSLAAVAVPLLREVEAALNRPSARRIPDAEGRAVAKALRALRAEDARYQTRLAEVLARLRCLLGVERVRWANRHRRILPQAPCLTSGPLAPLLERFREGRAGAVWVQILPHDAFFLLVEVLPTQEPAAPGVLYRYHLVKCIPDAIALRVSHVAPLLKDPKLETTAHKNPETEPLCKSLLSLQPSLKELRALAIEVQKQRVGRRQRRVRALLEHLGSAEPQRRRRCLALLPPADRAALADPPPPVSPPNGHLVDAVMPDLSRLLASLEDDFIIEELTARLDEQKIAHGRVVNNAKTGILTVDIHRVPSEGLPSWARGGAELVRRFARRLMLVGSSAAAAGSEAGARAWRLCAAFDGLPGRGGGSALWQSEPVCALRLADIDALVLRGLLRANFLALCRLFALCAPLLANPACLPPGMIVSSFDARSIVLAYGPGYHYLAEVSADEKQGFRLRLGVHPGPQGVPATATAAAATATGQQKVEQEQQTRRSDLFDNPHCVIREHLEALIETRKSLVLLCKVMMMTLDFLRCVEALRKPIVVTSALTKCWSRGVERARPVRSVALMALSCFDLQLAYRGTLCLRLRLLPAGGLVLLSDGCHNPAGAGGGISSEIYPVQGFVRLPAFQPFLESVRKAFKPNASGEGELGGQEQPGRVGEEATTAVEESTVSEGDASGGTLTLHQLECLLRPAPGGVSALEEWLAAGLTFHAAIQAASTAANAAASASQSGLSAWQLSGPPAVASGQFAAFASACLSLRFRLADTATAGAPHWRLLLSVAPDPAINAPPEFAPRIEEFFQRRVCSVTPQAAAITSFFRLLSLPAATLVGLVTSVFAWDLDPAGEGGALRVALVSPRPGPPEAAVALRPPSCVSLHLLFRPSAGTGPEVVAVTYDYVANSVVQFAPQHLAKHVELINQRFAAARVCTIVQLVSHIRQNLAEIRTKAAV